LIENIWSDYPINIDKEWKVLLKHIWAFGEKIEYNDTASLLERVKSNLYKFFSNDTISYDEIKLLKFWEIQWIPVSRIIWNLFKNAKEAGATKVYVTITKSYTKDILIVSDNGPWIDESIVKNVLFKKWISTKGENRWIWMHFLWKKFLEEKGSELQIVSLDEDWEGIEVLYFPTFWLWKITEDNIISENIEDIELIDKEFLERKEI